MRILVIGGTGFIGQHIVSELLRLRHEVIVFHRGSDGRTIPGRAAEMIGDRRRLGAAAPRLRGLTPDVVIDVILSSGTQATELANVFNGITGRVVALSSVDVYRACGVLQGLEAGDLEPLPLTESSALRTKLQTYPPAQIEALKQIFGWVDDEYDKIPAEKALLHESGLQTTVLRLPMVYGPGDPLHRFLPIVKRINDGRKVILFSESMAQWRATKGYVENIAAATAAAAVAETRGNRIYNLGELDTLTELQWAEEIARSMNWSGSFEVLPDDVVPPHLRAPGNAAQHWIVDTTAIRVELGIADRIDRSEAVSRTTEWERSQPMPGFTPHGFDYAAEDAVIGSYAGTKKPGDR